MKKITIVRHAKSSWEGNFADINRPLNTRGINDLKLMTSALRPYNLNPDCVLSSPANRALTTAIFFLENLNFNIKSPKIVDKLYDFSGNNLISVIKKIDNQYAHAMLFGHNHAITYFVNTYGDIAIANVPTCGLVSIDFPITNWSDLKKGHTTQVLFPSELRSR